MTCEVILQPGAERDFRRLPPDIQRRIREKLLGLEAQPRPHGSLKLAKVGGYRIRVGDYRILYDVDDGKRRVIVLGIGHRREIYR